MIIHDSFLILLSSESCYHQLYYWESPISKLLKVHAPFKCCNSYVIMASGQFIRDAMLYRPKERASVSPLHLYNLPSLHMQLCIQSHFLWTTTRRKELFTATYLERRWERQEWIACWILKWTICKKKDSKTLGKICWCWSLHIFIYSWKVKNIVLSISI